MDLNTGVYRGFGGLILRKDWLDELNLDVPQTLDDWETVLTAFRDKKGASAPLTGSVDKITTRNSFNSAFDIGLGIYVDGKTVKYGPVEPEYKEWLTLMNKWYSEKLIDSDYPTNANDTLNAKMTNGEAGAMLGYIGGSIGTYMNTMKTKDPNYELVAAPYPVKKVGDKARFAEAEADVQSIGAAITTNCKNPAMVAEWLDYLYSDDGYNLTNFGIEGESYNMVDGKPVYTDVILNNPDGKSISEALTLYCRATYPTPGLKQAEDYLKQYYQLDAQKEAMDLWCNNIDEIKATKLPNLTPTIEESDELTSLSDIATYVAEETQKFIQGVNSIDNYDNFVATLKSMNVDRYIEIYQNAYDRYLKR
jgi:putative aldouronate transport system substrate-binding protein